jgi:AhpD family alkylhydroperoxidase
MNWKTIVGATVAGRSFVPILKKIAKCRSEPLKDTNMMLNWNDYRKQLTTGVKEIGQLSPDTVKGYLELSSAGMKKDLLGAKIRELIALAVAVTARCDGCITVHADAAARHGATKEEIAEALGVAIAVNAGAALVYSTRVMDAVREHPGAA